MPASGVYQWLAVIQVNGAHYEGCVPILSYLFDAEFCAENFMSLRYYKQEAALFFEVIQMRSQPPFFFDINQNFHFLLLLHDCLLIGSLVV